MELRHLRYFVAVAEEGSLKLAAERRLHTAQPSLSRQIRDLEIEVGVTLLERSARGVALTEAGRAFLDHARSSIAAAQAAAETARRVALPAKTVFAVGFVVGHEVDCIPPTTNILRDDLPGLELRISSGFSVDLADELQRGTLDVAFLRREPVADLEYRLVLQEPIVAILPSDHRLAAAPLLYADDLAGETYIGISPIPRVLRGVVNAYVATSSVPVVPAFEIDNFAMAVSLVAAARGIALLPASVVGYLPGSVVSLPLGGTQPTIDLVLGYRTANRSGVLARFLANLGNLSAQVRTPRRAAS